METTFRGSLLRRLVLVAIMPLLAVGTLSVLGVWAFEESAIDHENALVVESVRVQAQSVLDTTESAVEAYRRSRWDGLTADPSVEMRWQHIIEAVVPIESLMLLDDAGRVRAASFADATPEESSIVVGLDRSAEPRYDEAADSGEAMWSDAHISPLTGHQTIAYLLPLESGMLIAEVSLAEIERILINRAASSSIPAIVDRNGVLLAHPDDRVASQHPNLSDIPLVSGQLAGGNESHGVFDWEASRYRGSAARIPETGWVVIAMRPTTDIRDSILRTTAAGSLVGLLAISLAAALGVMFASDLARPVRQLAERANAVAAGDYTTRPPEGRHKELRSLGEALNGMIEAVKERERAVAESERRFRFLVESLRAVPYEFDPGQDRFVYVGPQALTLLGYDIDAWVDMQSWIDMLHPDDRDEAERYCRSETATGRPHDLEYRMIASDGTEVWIKDIVTVGTSPDGDTRLVGVLFDITASKQLEQLRIAAQVAEGESKAKSTFLASMSHELRTPLNSIIGFGRILLQGLAGPINDEQRRQLEMIGRSGDHLLALVNDILDLEKIAAGEMSILEEDFDLGALVASSVDLVSTGADDKGLEITFTPPTRPIIVRSDEGRVRQILLNLLSNAVRYTASGGFSVDVVEGETAIRLTVADTGVGIDPGRLTEIFDEFKTLDRMSDNPDKSTGLGLAISRKLARLLGGEIEVASSPGEGSVFVLLLPVEPEA
ncbi:MAG: ATP-binding protein [Coriobacteriia bacterium]